MSANDQVSPRLQEIRKRAEKATAGPWHVERGHAAADRCDGIAAHIGHTHPPEQSCWDVDSCPGQDAEKIVQTDSGFYGPSADDAEFIAHAREDVPYLLGLIEAACSQPVQPGDVRQKCVNFLSRWPKPSVEQLHSFVVALPVLLAAPPAVSTPRCPSELDLQKWSERIALATMNSADSRDREARQQVANWVRGQLDDFVAQFFQPEAQPSPIGPERDPGECSYCEYCRTPIRERPLGLDRAWFDERGRFICHTAQDGKSLIGHKPKAPAQPSPEGESK